MARLGFPGVSSMVYWPVGAVPYTRQNTPIVVPRESLVMYQYPCPWEDRKRISLQALWRPCGFEAKRSVEQEVVDICLTGSRAQAESSGSSDRLR